jgi:hypothetical protein
MANYVSKVCFSVPLTAEQYRWAEAELERWDNATEDELHPSVDFEWRGDGVLIISDDANVTALARFLQRVMRQFQIAGAWGFEASCDCDQHRVDAYGGYAGLTTKDEIREVDTSDWLAETARAMGVELKNR